MGKKHGASNKKSSTTKAQRRDRRHLALLQAQSNGIATEESDSSVASESESESEDNDSLESGAGVRQQEEISGDDKLISSWPGLIVVCATIIMFIIEVHQLFNVYEQNGRVLDETFWDEGWQVVTSYWQSKLLALLFLLKTVFLPAPPNITNTKKKSI